MAANQSLYDQWIADSQYNAQQTQAGQFGNGWTPNENGGWSYNGQGINQYTTPETGPYGEKLTNQVRQQYGLALDPNQMSAAQPNGWDTKRLGDYAAYQPKGPQGWTSIQDAIDDYQYGHAQMTNGEQTIDRPWTYDADARTAGQQIADAWNQVSGQNITVDQLPVDQYAAGLPSEHKVHDGIMQTAFPMVLGAAGGAIFGPAGQFASAFPSGASETASFGAGAAGAAGSAGSVASSLPSNYWSMLADGGGATSDAAAAGAGTVGADAAAGGAAAGGGAAETGGSIWDKLNMAPPGSSSLIDGYTNATGASAGPSAFTGSGTGAGLMPYATGGTTLDSILNYGKGLLTPNNLISAGSNLAAGALNSNAAGKASQAQIDASNASIAEQRRQFDLTRADNAPYQATGVAANTALGSLLGVKGDSNAPGYGSLTKKFSAGDLNADPVYNSGLQFGLDQGLKGVNARAVQQGGYDSGATLKAITNYANDYGSTKANDSFNRFNTENTNIYNKLAGVSGAGQAANSLVGTVGQNSANNVSQSLQDQGNSRAAGIVGGANAWGAAAQNINNNYQNSQMTDVLRQILGRGAGGTFQGPY